MKFLVTQQEDGKFSFTLSDNDSNLVLSSINFNDRDACVAAIRGLTQDLPTRSNYQIATEGGSSIFNVSSGGQTVASSPGFASSQLANEAADSLSDDTSDEPNYSVEVKTFSTSNTTTTREQVILPAMGDIDFASLYDFSYASPKNTKGFESFNRKDKNASYFHFNDANGQALLYSRSFDANSKREKRIRQVIAASSKPQRLEIVEDGNSFYFILKERNNLEIARSRNFTSRAEAESSLAFVKANASTYASAYPEPVKRKNVNQYDFDISPSSEEAGFDAIKGADKQHYFLLKDASGKPILYSQGYGSGVARDNGIKTTIKNGIEAARYEKIEKGGKYSFILRAGNRQEIAKSPAFDTNEERNEAMEWLLGNTRSYSDKYGVSYDTKGVITENTESFMIDMPAPVMAAAIVEPEVKSTPNATNRQIDEYLPCESYAGHTDSPADGIRTFKGDDGQYYFSVIDGDGNVSMRSESYPTISGRDNGVASVLKNRDNKARYAEIEENDVHYVILKAGNGQEIARSCPSKEKMGLLGFLPLLGVGALGLGGMVAATGATPLVEAVSPVVEVPQLIPPAVALPTVAPLAMAEPEIIAATGGLPKWLLPLIGLVILAAILWWLLKGCKAETPAVAVGTPVMVDTVKVAATSGAVPSGAVPVAPVGEQADGFAPVTLYFENDQPGKSSQAETTALTYNQTYDKYIKLKDKFDAEQDTPEAKTAIDNFFENDVKKGHDDLKVLTKKIVEAVKAGNKVEVTVKAFASPLAANDYNERLTKRRIASIANYFNAYEGGTLKKYADKINIIQQPNGESSSVSGLSDDEKNVKLSVYDLKPSKERRVEILDVRLVKE